MKVAILGFGTVGSGVAEVLRQLPELSRPQMGQAPSLKYIVDLREVAEDSIFRPFWTKDAAPVLEDPEVRVVVETIGGSGIAYKFTKAALQAKKHVVTSNKALVAEHGRELLQVAADNGVHYLFEASVGGGIPIIHPLKHCLAANDISSIVGILNGTTNYILNRMEEDGIDFKTALAEAQGKGYAEKDPTADIEGHDTARKIAILCSVASAAAVPYQAGIVEGISQITPREFALARQAGFVIKLLAIGEKDADGRIGMKTAVHLIPRQHALAAVRGVINAVQFSGSAVGETMFQGPGAGSIATASAVVSDILEALHSPVRKGGEEVWKELDPTLVIEAAKLPVKALLVPLSALPNRSQQDLLSGVGAKILHKVGDYTAFIVGEKRVVLEGELKKLMEQLRSSGDWIALRIYRSLDEAMG